MEFYLIVLTIFLILVIIYFQRKKIDTFVADSCTSEECISLVNYKDLNSKCEALCNGPVISSTKKPDGSIDCNCTSAVDSTIHTPSIHDVPSIDGSYFHNLHGSASKIDPQLQKIKKDQQIQQIIEPKIEQLTNISSALASDKSEYTKIKEQAYSRYEKLIFGM